MQTIDPTTRSKGARSPSRLGRALRVGRVATVLCPRCKALAVRTPPPHCPELQWYRCQSVGCRHLFAPDDSPDRERDS